MNKQIIKFTKNAFAVSVAVFMVFGPALPGLVPAANAASFNDSGSPYKLLRGSNYTDNPGCSTCWVNNSLSADADDTVSLRLFIHNDSGEAANNVTASIIPNITSGGSKVTFTGTIKSNNASTETDTFEVNVNGDADNVKHLSTFVYDGFGVSKSFSGSASNVETSGGITVGTVNSGLGNVRFVVARFKIEGDGGSSGGDDLSVTTLSADNIDEDSARLRCDVDTGDYDADVWFEWGTSSGNLNKDTSDVSVNDNESNERVTKTITGLDSDKKYYFRCVAEDDDGETDKGSIRNFTTDDNGRNNGDDPQVTTLAATSIDNNSATLRCEVDPNGEDTDAWFEWGTSSTNLNRDTPEVDVGDGNSDVDHSARISGLTVNTTYFYRCLAENRKGDDRGSVRSFRTTAPIVNVVTRFVDVFRTVEVEPERDIEALIITLNADSVNADRGTIEYLVSYDNRTRLFLRNVELTVEIPNELNFIDSRPNPSRDLGDQLIYNIGRVEAGEQGSFLIETELARNVDSNDLIRLVAHVEYNDDSSILKIVEVIDENTYGELVGRSNLTANIFSALRDFFTSPILWLILFIALIVFVARYLFAARTRRDTSLV